MLRKALGPGQVPGLRPAREPREARREEGGFSAASRQVLWFRPARERKQKAQQKAQHKAQEKAPASVPVPAPLLLPAPAPVPVQP